MGLADPRAQAVSATSSTAATAIPAAETGAEAVNLAAITLESATDFAGFRSACRSLWAAQVTPERVVWNAGDDAESDLFAEAGATPLPPPDPDVPPLLIPKHLLPEIGQAALHADADRFGLLYRFVWRLQTEPGLRDDALDADVVRIRQMAQAVRRDMHKTKAFVRFRTVAEDARAGPPPAPGDDLAAFDAFDAGAAEGIEDRLAAADGSPPAAVDGLATGPLHVAWFEPEHHTTLATAPFFVRRFAHMRWAILTPEHCVEWNGRTLVAGPGVRRDQAPPADAGEALWLTYYESIFNPARLKLKMMKKEMPVKYWKNLPEAERISGLVAAAGERTTLMIDREPAAPSPRQAVRPASLPEAVAADHDPASTGALAAQLDRCRECPIGEHATQAVPGEGRLGARLMFVGEQPGDVEDLKGRPFVGPAGQLFDRALAQLGIDRGDTWITNAVKHFKFELRGKRRIHKTPAQQEAAACLHWLETEIGLVDPEAMVALGATAARQLMGRAVAVTRERGQWLQRGDGRRVLITLHPSALLRMEPEHKEAAWTAWLADLQHAADALRPTGGAGRA